MKISWLNVYTKSTIAVVIIGVISFVAIAIFNSIGIISDIISEKVEASISSVLMVVCVLACVVPMIIISKDDKE
jgi:hypothetical protein